MADSKSDSVENVLEAASATEAANGGENNSDCNSPPTDVKMLQADAADEADNSSGSGEVSESDSDSEPATKCIEGELEQPSKAKEDNGSYDQMEAEDCDDRSQTPLQDEIENIQGLGNVDDISALAENDKVDRPKSSPLNKESTVNDDHGELDYEEDEMMDDGQDKTKVDNDTRAPEKKSQDAKPDPRESDAASSDGELADDDDCEEGEIKEPGTKKPFIRPLCRFFTRGNCTWGINCRFLHPGINDKGNYSLIEQQHSFQPMPPPGMLPILRGPPPSWIHERLGKRMLPPPRPSELHQSESDGTAPSSIPADGPSSESAWERGLRHAKEIQRKRKDTDGDEKKEKEESVSPSTSPSVGSALPSQLAPPPPRDPYYDDIHRPLPPPMPGRIPLPMPLPPPIHHPPDAWSYRHPFEYDMRWHRPPPEFVHLGFPPGHDARFMDRERMAGGMRFSPPLRMDPSGRKDERLSRYDRYRSSDGQSGMETSRGKCEEWKDPWLRTKSPKKKHDSSSRSGSRDRKRSRSKRSYSSFSSSSYSSKSRSRSSSFSSYSSSRSSFTSRSRSSSKSGKSIPKKVVPVGSTLRKQSPFENSAKSSEPPPKSVVTKVIPPSLADMNSPPSSKPTSMSQQSATSFIGGSTSTITAQSDVSKPTMTSLSITIAGKPSGTSGRANQLQPVGKAVAEAFKDVDDEIEDDVKVKSKMSKLPPSDFNKSNEITTAGGMTYKSGIVQGNVGYPIPVKVNPYAEASKTLATDGQVKLTSPRSSSSSGDRSSSSHSNNSHSSSSRSGDSDHIYSDIASPISSDSSISQPQPIGLKLHTELSHAMSSKGPDHHISRTLNMTDREIRDLKGVRCLEVRPEKREYRDVRVPPGDLARVSRKDYRADSRPDYDVRTDARIDPKMMPRKTVPSMKNEPMMMMMQPDRREPRGDVRDHYRNEMQKIDVRAELKGSNVRREHSRSRERLRTTIHAQMSRRDERGSQGRVVQDSSMEYRRVVHSGPSSNKVDARQFQTSKRPASPHSRSPKRMRMPTDHKEPVKIPIPKPDKITSGRANVRTSKDGFEDPRAQFQSSSKPTASTKVTGKKSTSTRREELLQQLKAVEDAIAKKRSKNQ